MDQTTPRRIVALDSRMDDGRILIVGAGPTGLMLAIELARLGVRPRIIEKRSERTSTSRALGVFARTLELFERIGVIDEALAAGRRLHGATIHSGNHVLASLSTDALKSPFPFILSLPQSETERILETRATELGVRIERNTECESIERREQSVIVRVRRAGGAVESAEFAWVVGCDGAHSTVRRDAGIEFDGVDLHQSFVFADAKVDWDVSPDRVHVFFSPLGVVAAIALPDEAGWRVIVSLPPGESPPSDPSLEAIQTMARARLDQDVTLHSATWLAGFEVRQRKVAAYRDGRLLLAGDAAHAHSPVGGQGMNTGLQDASNLAWKLALVSRGAADPGLLDTYNEEREPIARELLRGTSLATRIVTLHASIAQAIRNVLAQIAFRFDMIQDRLVETLSELRIDYRGCTLSKDWAPRGRLHAGDRAPDAALTFMDGRTTRLFDVLRAPGMHIFIMPAADESISRSDSLEKQIEAAARSFSGCPIAVHCVQALAESESGLVGQGSSCWLVRPDGYIGLRLAPIDGARFNQYLSMFRSPAPGD